MLLLSSRYIQKQTRTKTSRSVGRQRCPPPILGSFLVVLQPFIPFIKVAACHRGAFLPDYPWVNMWFRRGPARVSGHGPECVVALEYCLSFLPLPWSSSIQQELYQKWIVKALSRHTIFRKCPCDEGHSSLCSIVTPGQCFSVKFNNKI